MKNYIEIFVRGYLRSGIKVWSRDIILISDVPQQVSESDVTVYCKFQNASTYEYHTGHKWRSLDVIFLRLAVNFNSQKRSLMKFGKNLNRMVELSDPEWGPYWINYKFMKKKIKELAENSVCPEISDACNPSVISKSAPEVEFFLLLKTELKKTAHHFSCAEQLCDIRHQRVQEGLAMLYDQNNTYDKKMWTRLLMACVKFYKDILLLENFAIMNYCGFSKILKKHDKSTGYLTRDAFMRNVMSQQNFTHYPHVLYLLQQSEKLFAEIQGIESSMPLLDEERLFIDAMRGLNSEASKLLMEESKFFESTAESNREIVEKKVT